jgi:hypothetical protein
MRQLKSASSPLRFGDDRDAIAAGAVMPVADPARKLAEIADPLSCSASKRDSRFPAREI